MLVRRNLQTIDRVFDNLGPLGRMLDDTYGLGTPDSTLSRAWVPAVDIAEDAKSFVLKLEVPGVKPTDVKIELDGNRLMISGEKRQVNEDKSERVHRFERSYGSFRRAFTLPDTVNTEGITAASENGVLVVTLPKTEKARPRTISVQSA